MTGTIVPLQPQMPGKLVEAGKETGLAARYEQIALTEKAFAPSGDLVLYIPVASVASGGGRGRP